MVLERRNPVIAAILSLVTPGLGQLYNGQGLKGISFAGAELLMALLLCYSRMPVNEFYGLLLLLAVIFLVLTFPLFIIGEAYFTAKRLKAILPRLYNRWYVYLPIIILTASLPSTMFPNDKREFVRAGLFRGLKTYRIASDSMNPTLFTGDYLMVDTNHSSRQMPRRGEIVFFRSAADPSRHLVKRVVATEGDTLEVRNMEVILNGVALNEPYVQRTHQDFLPDKNPVGPLKVPGANMFVMADNRDDGLGSQHFGCIEKTQIIGKPLYIYWASEIRRIGRKLR